MNIHDATEAAYKRGYEAGKPKWISVKDRLPEFGENVLTYSPEEKVSPKYCNAYIGKNGEWIERAFFERPLGKVTHWMPLQEPPEVEE